MANLKYLRQTMREIQGGTRKNGPPSRRPTWA